VDQLVVRLTHPGPSDPVLVNDLVSRPHWAEWSEWQRELVRREARILDIDLGSYDRAPDLRLQPLTPSSCCAALGAR